MIDYPAAEMLAIHLKGSAKRYPTFHFLFDTVVFEYRHAWKTV